MRAWRLVSCKCSMNGWPEYRMPIRIEIMRSLVLDAVMLKEQIFFVAIKLDLKSSYAL